MSKPFDILFIGKLGIYISKQNILYDAGITIGVIIKMHCCIGWKTCIKHKLNKSISFSTFYLIYTNNNRKSQEL